MNWSFYRAVVLLLLVIWSSLFSLDFQISGQNETRLAVDSIGGKDPSRYLQEWFDLTLGMGSLDMNLGFEAHIPPFPGSFAPKDSTGILHRSISYRYNSVTIRAGHFFTTLGKGITLHSYEDRELGWNTNIDGIQFQFNHEKLEAQIFGGKMRDTDGNRYDLIEGGAVRFLPGEVFYPGLTAVVTRIGDHSHYWGSLTGELYLPFGQIEAEFAAFDFGKKASGFAFKNMFTDWNSFLSLGRAAYLNGTFNAGPITLFLEGKNYKAFALGDKALTFNAPPTVTREHIFGLFSDMKPDVFKGGSEKGFLFEATGTLPGENLFSLSYSNSREEDSQDLLFDELYGQVDWQFSLVNTMTAIGFQRDAAGQYLHGAVHGELSLKKLALKGEFAHQHRKFTRNFDPAREFFYQTFELGIGYKSVVLTGIGAATSDPDKKKGETNLYTKGWFGGQVNVTINEKHRLAFFAGTRKGGKICAGGLCVKKPELRGAELIFISTF